MVDPNPDRQKTHHNNVCSFMISILIRLNRIGFSLQKSLRMRQILVCIRYNWFLNVPIDIASEHKVGGRNDL